MKWKSVVCGAILSVALAAPTEAAVTGTLKLTAGDQGVTVGLTFIDFLPADVPPGSGDGTFITSVGTNVTYTAVVGDGLIDQSDPGVILDIDSPPPLLGFMTFPNDTEVSFDLITLGPGSPNTDCSTVDVVGESCSPFVGSPFILTLTQDLLTGNFGTAVTLGASGTATDASVDVSVWFGAFTTQIPGLTPEEIQDDFGCQPGMGVAACTNTSHTITDTYSGSFLVTFVTPEPTMLALFGIGLLGAGARARRRRG